MNNGQKVEDVVEYLCMRSFFADFIFRSPEYTKQGGQQKEAADFLIIFKRTLLAIQVKSKEIPHNEKGLSDTEEQRIWNRIEKATDQFHALAEALNNPHFKAFRNSRGSTITFDKSQITEISLIVIFAPIHKEDPEKDVRIKFKGAQPTNEHIPLHLFTLQEFWILSKLMDTLPDFLVYLDARWLLHREKLIPPDVEPLDEWAFLTFERKKVAKTLENKSFIDISGYAEKYSKSLPQLEEMEKPSYLVDRLIELSNLAIDHPVPMNKKFSKLANATVRPNSENAFHLVIPHLIKLNRRERTQLAEQFLIRARKCKNQPISFGGFKFEHHDEAYVLLASKWNTRQRQIALYNIGMLIGHELKVKTVVALSGGVKKSEYSLSEAMVIDISNLKLNETQIQASKQLLKGPRIHEAT